MNYILCSVIWTADDAPPGFTSSLIAAARLTEDGEITENNTFLIQDHSSCGDMLREFTEWCGDEYMLCVWDGYSAGRIKKLLAANGIRHPYVHLYHLVRVYELSMEKCRDIRQRRIMQTRLEGKPYYYGKKNAAELEVRWMSSIFEMLDFSVMEKKPSIDFIDQPSNKYFVFKNGKCFHSKECRIVKEAPVSSLRSYTYYATAVDAGFTPCSRCKPVDMDAETAAQMQKLNEVKRTEAKAKHIDGFVPKKKKRTKPVSVFKSLAHMCGLYGVSYKKSGENVFVSTESGSWRFAPENDEIILFKQNKSGEYTDSKKRYSDPYSAVRDIVKGKNNTKKK